jgi:hypothetical protein
VKCLRRGRWRTDKQAVIDPLWMIVSRIAPSAGVSKSSGVAAMSVPLTPSGENTRRSSASPKRAVCDTLDTASNDVVAGVRIGPQRLRFERWEFRGDAVQHLISRPGGFAASDSILIYDKLGIIVQPGGVLQQLAQ